VSLTKDHNITTGKVYKAVIDRERKGDYLGKTVQVVPHITNEIMDWIERVAPIPVDEHNSPADVCLVEVGGTVGDIESMVFLEALRQFQFRVGRENIFFVHVSLVPILSDEQKTKPTQHGVKELRTVGLSPDAIICRSVDKLQQSTCHKIALFCHVRPENVMSVHNVSNVYHVPLMLHEQKILPMLHAHLHFPRFAGSELVPDLEKWAGMAHAQDAFTQDVRIALVGKYTGMADAYLSVLKALKHAAIECGRNLDLVWLESGDLEAPPEGTAMDESSSSSSSTTTSSSSTTPSASSSSSDDVEVSPAAKHAAAWAKLKSCSGIIVPGGFGSRGVEGKILTAKYARENKVPYLGVCLGMQMLVVEYARNVLGWEGAHSVEFDDQTAHPTVVFMPEIDKATMGGNMRLGARDTILSAPTNHGGAAPEPSMASRLYGGAERVSERHRHRYEVNPEKVQAIEKAGLNLVGRDETGERMEIAELPRAVHPFYLGVQYHPEFKSRPLAPSPPFHGLILAASGQLDDWVAALDSKKRKR
jgi:CTP synthase